MSLELNTRQKLLQDRAYMLQQARAFFYVRGVLELDCPILNATCNIDDFIDPFKVNYCNDKTGYLHTSPELFMKKLLAEGVKDMFFLGHVFRDHEKGSHHHVEFTMVEWYRLNLDYQEFIKEVIDFIRLFFDVGQITTLSYHEALLKWTGIDYLKVSKEALLDYIQKNLSIGGNLKDESFSDLLTLIFTEKVEPHFEELGFVVLKSYPKEQAALAKVETVDGMEVAKRFELYYKGVELANGYDELVGSSELENRFIHLNKKRALRNKEELPIDLDFIQANEKLPDCRGVAVGFDRLMMLRHQGKSIHSSMALI